MGGKGGSARGLSVNSSLAKQTSTAAALAFLRKADDLLTLCARKKGGSSREDIKSQMREENWVQLVFDVINDARTSLADLRFLSKVFEKITDFIISDPVTLTQDSAKSMLISEKVDFHKFLAELSSAEIAYYGASLWLAYCKFFVTIFGTKMPSKEWNDFFSPMETWFRISDGEAVAICLRVWTSFIVFAAPRLSSGVLREKLLANFSKPLRSHAVINKLSTPAPIISAYTTLISVFRHNVDERFEELIICFLRFVTGKPAIPLEDEKAIEKEIRKPISEKNLKFVLEGPSSDFLEYLTDSRPHKVFEDAFTHVFPVICSVLGTGDSDLGIPLCNDQSIVLKHGVLLTQATRFAGHVTACETNAKLVCSCFAALGRRIETIKNGEARRREARFLFIQIRAWIAESAQTVEAIEGALSQLFEVTDLSIHANTVGEWPAMNLLKAILEKTPAKISRFLALLPGTLYGGMKADSVVLQRLGQLCCTIEEYIRRFDARSMLQTWCQLAEVLTDFIKETDDINEGNLLKPNFSITFNFLTLLFKIANCADEDMDANILTKCLIAFGKLYAEVQTTVRHEVDCNAGTVLQCVFGSDMLLETTCSTHIFITALLSVVDIYPFGHLTKEDVFSGSAVDFNALGEMTTFVEVIKPLVLRITSSFDSEEDEKPPHYISSDFLSVLKICRKLFEAVEEPSLVRTLFLAMCDALDNMLCKIYCGEVCLKEITQDSLAVYVAIMDNVQNKISGPFDDSLLSGCAPLLTRLLSGRRGRFSKLRTAACNLWKNTFAKAQSLTYPVELRNVLQPLVRKRVISAPGFAKVCDSNEDIFSGDEDMSFTVSPSNASQSFSRPHRAGKAVKMEIGDSHMENGSCSSSHAMESKVQTGKKRGKSKASINEDSGTPDVKVAKKEPFALGEAQTSSKKVERKESVAVPIKSPKAEQVTPSRQAATPRIKRRVCAGLLDEDSVDYVPVVSSESAKKMKLTDRQREIFSEKRDRMPFLDEDSQNSAVITHLASEYDVESSQSLSSSLAGLDLPRPCPLPSSGVVKQEQKDELVQNDAAAAPTPVKRLEGIAGENAANSRRKPKLKLNFDEVEICEDSLTSPGFVVAPQSEGSSKTEQEENLPDLQPGNSSSTEELSSSEESTAPSNENEMSVNMKNGEMLSSRRSRKKTTPSKYIDQKKRAIGRSAEKERKTPSASTPKSRRRPSISPEKEVAEECTDLKKPLPPTQEATAQQSHEALVLREIEDVLSGSKSNTTGLDESLDEEDEEVAASKTPEKQIMEAGRIAATPTPAVVQRIASTPGILKKVDSPSTAEKKLRRVHFGAAMENSSSNMLDDDMKAIKDDDIIPVSPREIVKKATPRRPFFPLQTAVEQVTKIAALPNESTAASPIKTEADSASSADDEPIFPRLVDCQESIGRIVGRLLPISSTNGAVTARKSLEAKGIIKICDLASMSRREVSLLNIKKPRIETVLRTLSQFARDHLKSEASPEKYQDSVSKQELLEEVVEVHEEITMALIKEPSSSVSFTVPIFNISEAELNAMESDRVNLTEVCCITSDKSIDNKKDVEVKADDIGEVVLPVSDEKKRLLESVRDAYRQLDAVMNMDLAHVDLVRLRRAASKTARSLLDLVSWCDDATP
ncbi:hypothetical protein GCK32_001033 [Trichostrongylus colubriformis]|uniref:Telomere-associated protein Rif1 N-terminal domain-containing protein n=1 Tax=Trichostrongylus colubriformis TaxID=6319 RepID=A0AAN8F7M1_TRICO